MERFSGLETDHLVLQQQHALCEVQIESAALRALEEEQRARQASKEKEASSLEVDRLKLQVAELVEKCAVLEEEVKGPVTCDVKA